MATYNGGQYLAAQLKSLADQSLDNFDLVVSDDGSSDDTLEILQETARSWTKGKFEIVEGPKRGFAENFRHLLLAFSADYDFVAFSDQDDVWDDDKLEVAINCLSTQGNQPALYCGRTRYIDEAGNFLRLSGLFTRPPSIKNALVQSIAGANTMLLNKGAAKLVCMASQEHSFVSHDWWSYIVVAACGGKVLYDRTPHIGYRQHDANILGANSNLGAQLQRGTAMLQGRFRRWNDSNLAGLETIRKYWTPEAEHQIDIMHRVRQVSIFKGLFLWFNAGFYRQTLLGNAGVFAAVVLKRF